MPVTIAASMNNGPGTAFAFPDVCKISRGQVPLFVPIPYPSIAKTAQAAQNQKKVKFANKKGSTTKGNIEIKQLRGKISYLNAKLLTLRSKDPNRWQELLTDYVVAASALYVTQEASGSQVAPAGAQVAPSQTKVLVSS